MAKLSQVLRDQRRKKLIAKYAEKRAALRKRLNDANVSIEEKFQIQEQFAKLPRNSCPTRLNRRCEVSGRSRSYYRKFGISRIALRDLALSGQLPGVRKSSW
jgi:small subunit ribosomal protein S14